MRYFTWILLSNSGYIMSNNDPFISYSKTKSIQNTSKTEARNLHHFFPFSLSFSTYDYPLIICLILYILLTNGSWNLLLSTFQMSNSNVPFPLLLPRQSYCDLPLCMFLISMSVFLSPSPSNGSLSNHSRTVILSMRILNQDTMDPDAFKNK